MPTGQAPLIIKWLEINTVNKVKTKLTKNNPLKLIDLLGYSFISK
jgi:hypothetical protein